jgi:hypothetical protein
MGYEGLVKEHAMKARVFTSAGEYCFKAEDGMTVCDWDNEDDASEALNAYQEDGTRPRAGAIRNPPDPALTAKFFPWAATRAAETQKARDAESTALAALKPGTRVRVHAERWNPAIYAYNGKIGTVSSVNTEKGYVKVRIGAIEIVFGPTDLVRV